MKEYTSYFLFNQKNFKEIIFLLKFDYIYNKFNIIMFVLNNE